MLPPPVWGQRRLDLGYALHLQRHAQPRHRCKTLIRILAQLQTGISPTRHHYSWQASYSLSFFLACLSCLSCILSFLSSHSFCRFVFKVSLIYLLTLPPPVSFLFPSSHLSTYFFSSHTFLVSFFLCLFTLWALHIFLSSCLSFFFFSRSYFQLLTLFSFFLFSCLSCFSSSLYSYLLQLYLSAASFLTVCCVFLSSLSSFSRLYPFVIICSELYFV